MLQTPIDAIESAAQLERAAGNMGDNQAGHIGYTSARTFDDTMR